MSSAQDESALPPATAASTHPFSLLVKTTRSQTHLSQPELAKALHKTKQWINAIEKSDLPAVEHVVPLHDELLKHALPHLPERQREASRGFWLLTWLAQHANRSGSEPATRSIAAALRLFPDASAATTARTTATLERFPAGFDRLIVIGGDRREAPAHSGGDLLAYSASVLDLRFLNRLGLGARDVTIWHDKVFVQMSEEYLERQFGRSHLLVVGSPAANFAARRINGQSLFRFNIPADTRAWDRTVQSTFPLPVPYADEKRLAVERRRGIFRLQGRPDAEVVDRLLQAFERDEEFAPEKHLDEVQSAWFEARRPGITAAAEQLLGGRKPSDWIRRLRPLEIADPINGELHALEEDVGKRLDEDLAVISVGANPFADPDAGYVSILVAGIHGPGTAHALKVLGDEDLADRPLGGVLKVTLKPDRDLPDRVHEATPTWLTRPYALDEVVRCFTLGSGAFTAEWKDELPAWHELADRLSQQSTDQ